MYPLSPSRLNGWLRPAVFGAMDGLVTNLSLVAGVSAGGFTPHAVILAGLAAMMAGSLSMALGEYVSVAAQNDEARIAWLSPWVAALSSLGCFAVGAVIPLLPYLLGATSLAPGVALGAAGLLGSGAVTARLTGRSWWRGALRQLLLGGVAVGLTFLAGSWLR